MRYRKKPAVVDAFQMTLERQFDKEWPDWLRSAWEIPVHLEGALFHYAHSNSGALAIRTLEGVVYVSYGDWIIRGVAGEIYPCKPDIFDATYEAVPDETALGT